MTEIEKGTILHELLQVVRVASQMQDEGGSSNLLLDVLIEQLHVLINVVDVGLFIQLEGIVTTDLAA